MTVTYNLLTLDRHTELLDDIVLRVRKLTKANTTAFLIPLDNCSPSND